MKIIVLIHGWDYRNYTKFNQLDAWHNRQSFINELSKSFLVYRMNLPGFCGEPEPDNPWLIDDFACFFQDYLVQFQIVPDLVLGYSFGAAVAIRWKIVFKNNIKLALVSPAIRRNYKKKTLLEKFFVIKNIIPSKINTVLRDRYLKIIKNKFYTEATDFLKKTYLNIVRVDLVSDLTLLSPNEILLIFGNDDTVTPPKILIDNLEDKNVLSRIVKLPDGNHDIANTHYIEITNYLVNYINNENRFTNP